MPKSKPTPEQLLLYVCVETDPEQVQTLSGIEEAVRGHILEHVSPEIGNFLSKPVAAPVPDENVPSRASLGN
ncbi:MAG: hypothetical protein F6K50_11685 [Moorea sp. SIO3I7]|nr:hypothetical protein [Moorena sp. SIO3I7]NEO10066.1 hypothetical protein [Moorena sp. SIO3I8]